MPHFLLILWSIVNQGDIILAIGIAMAAVNIEVGANLILAMVGRVFIVLDLLDLREGRLVVLNSCEADGFELLTQSSLGVLKIVDVDLSLVDRGSRRMELVNGYLKIRSCLRMCESQIDALCWPFGEWLQLIDNELAHVLANVRGQLGRWQTPEEIFGGKFGKYTH
jgi:hypothetical protein